MSQIIITGASDDLIEIDGDLSEEFNYQNESSGDLLAFSDGTLLRIIHDSDGTWRITRLVRGAATFDLEQAAAGDRSDKATLDLVGAFTWVVQGVDVVKAKG